MANVPIKKQIKALEVEAAYHYVEGHIKTGRRCAWLLAELYEKIYCPPSNLREVFYAEAVANIRNGMLGGHDGSITQNHVEQETIVDTGIEG